MDDDRIRDYDWQRLSPEARALLRMLAGLRAGRTVEEAAERLGVVVDAVVEHIVEDDNGNVKGPKGTLTLTLEVAPANDPRGNTVTVREKIAARYPEDRDHVLYVGKRSTLHTQQDTTGMLFAVQDGHVVDPDGSDTPDDPDDPHRVAAQAD